MKLHEYQSKLIFADHGIGHDDHPIVTGTNAGGSQANFRHIAPGALALDCNPVANAIGLVGQDDEAGDGIGKSVLGGQGQGQATDAKSCQEGSEVDAEMSE